MSCNEGCNKQKTGINYIILRLSQLTINHFLNDMVNFLQQRNQIY